MTAPWRVTFDNRTAFVAGPKADARRRLTVCGDHSPTWVSRRDAWATSPATARRLLDQLDARNITVSIDDEAQVALDLSDTEPANVPSRRQESLW